MPTKTEGTVSGDDRCTACAEWSDPPPPIEDCAVCSAIHAPTYPTTVGELFE